MIVATPEVEKSYCHTASYACAVAALAALFGEDISSLPDAVAAELEAGHEPVSERERWLVAGAGSDWATAQELCSSSVRVPTSPPKHTHGADAARTPGRGRRKGALLRARGRRPRRGTAHGLVAALGEIGCETTLVPTRHPVVDIVRFQLLTVDLAEARGVDPDMIRFDEPRWKRARDSYA